MTTSETAKAIREELKNRLGLNRKSVSVRKNRGSAVYVEILDPEVCIEKVEEIANNYESYQRCEATQEILQGGNTFVFVRYSSEAQKIVDAYNENTPLDEVDFYEETEEIKEEIEAKINKAKENNHENREIVILIHKKTKASKATKIRYTYNQDCYTLGEREIWIGKEVYLVAAIVPVKEETEEQTTTEENQTEEISEEIVAENTLLEGSNENVIEESVKTNLTENSNEESNSVVVEVSNSMNEEVLENNSSEKNPIVAKSENSQKEGEQSNPVVKEVKQMIAVISVDKRVGKAPLDVVLQ